MGPGSVLTEGGLPSSPALSLWPQAPETTQAVLGLCQGPLLELFLPARLPDLPQPRRHLCGPWATLSQEGRLPWAGVAGYPRRPLLALPAPTRPPAPGLSSVPRVPTAPLPQCSLFPGHTGGHCSEGQAGQQSAFCGWCLGMPLVAWGGWGGDAEAGPGEEGQMGCTEVRLTGA